MNNICYAIIVGCAIFNLVMLFVNLDNLFLRRKIRKERELRQWIISHERFRLDLPAAGNMDEGTVDVKGIHSGDETGDVKRLFGVGFEYAGEWSPMGSVVFSKRDPLVATFVLKTDLTDLDADLSRIDGFDLILRPFSKPIRDNALEKGHVRLWLAREARVKVGQQGDNGGDAAEHGTGDQK